MANRLKVLEIGFHDVSCHLPYIHICISLNNFPSQIYINLKLSKINSKLYVSVLKTSNILLAWVMGTGKTTYYVRGEKCQFLCFANSNR